MGLRNVSTHSHSILKLPQFSAHFLSSCSFTNTIVWRGKCQNEFSSLPPAIDNLRNRAANKTRTRTSVHNLTEHSSFILNQHPTAAHINGNESRDRVGHSPASSPSRPPEGSDTKTFMPEPSRQGIAIGENTIGRLIRVLEGTAVGQRDVVGGSEEQRMWEDVSAVQRFAGIVVCNLAERRRISRPELGVDMAVGVVGGLSSEAVLGVGEIILLVGSIGFRMLGDNGAGFSRAGGFVV